MIHDVLLSCLNLYSTHLPIEEFVESDAVSKFLHPCEKKILQDIIGIVNLLRDIIKFTKTYGSNDEQLLNSPIVVTDDPLQGGLYLRAFANGIDIVLEDYFEEITELERRYLQNPTQSLLFIYQKLKVYEPLVLFLRKIIRGISTQKLHGCAILKLLYQNKLHGDPRICKAIRSIQSTVNVVFLKQLTHWILYAKTVDRYGEFFIQNSSETQNNSTLESEKNASTGSGVLTNTTMSDAASTCNDIWCYEICHEQLPHYLSSSWADKVLFIGQTVLMFKNDSNKVNKIDKTWYKPEKNIFDGESSLWNENEHIYFGKIQALQDDAEINVSHYERVIDEIKNYATARLSEKAINQADLVQQLKLIKDFFLLGRGELFLEFIRKTYVINCGGDSDNKLRDYVKAFESAAHAVGVSEELEQFSLYVPKNEVDITVGYMQQIQLQYKIIYPLHLLFSPSIMLRYNKLFQFLLEIKKNQYDLHMLWCKHTRESKLNKTQNIKVMHLRNQLMFFVDNLQYYIQVDVLESQFSILMNTVLNKADFEEIQRAHFIFIANILSQCFVDTDEDFNKPSVAQSALTYRGAKVIDIIQDIFHVFEDFCELLKMPETIENFETDIDGFEARFGSLIEILIKKLANFKAAARTTPLSQLLLRLDFNHWFSSKKKRDDNEF